MLVKLDPQLSELLHILLSLVPTTIKLGLLELHVFGLSLVGLLDLLKLGFFVGLLFSDQVQVPLALPNFSLIMKL